MISHLRDFSSFLPIALFFTLWVAFPVWLAMRRSQGLIRFERADKEGEVKQIGMYLELGIFIFAIPFTTFFLCIVINLILLPFISDIGTRFQKSLETSFMIMSIALFLYIYAAEKKIYLRTLKEREAAEEDED